MEFLLTTLFSDAAITIAPPIDAKPEPKKRTWLPLLTVLFMISYGLMTMLIVEQGSTIESQRALIRELFRDSTELSSMKIKAQQAARTQSPSSQAQTPSVQTPSTQAPSTQAPSQQAPSSQAAPQNRAQNQSEKQSPQFRAPTKPAADLSDARRALKTI